MKMNIKELLKTGRYSVLLLVSILLYIVITGYFYFENILYPTALHAPDKPFIIYVIKWSYSAILGLSLINIKKKPQMYWYLINRMSICILLLSGIMFYLSFVFYVSIFDMFLLETISILCLLYSNTDHFILVYKIKRTSKEIILNIIIPIIITIPIFFLLYSFQQGDVLL